ncbi:prepilin-type N-terminal cleavage/methylation domain-containing protein [Patescibacteria group bacterium]|nr:prepilin-type N-terminal cleavage/methylation domain-containing protein [Patescibacteria group bacterium]
MRIGFTLIEVLITVIIFLLVSVAIFNIYIVGQKFYQGGEIRAELLQNGRVVLERMTREIRQAREIVTELSEQESGATSTILFEDGHSTTTYRYICYFRDDDLVKKEVNGYYFSDDPSQTLVSWDSNPPEGQTLETKILEEPKIIGEYIIDLKFWGSKVIHTVLTLQNRAEVLELRTKVFARNL